MNNVWQLPVEKPAQQYLNKTYENEILVHWSKEMWITNKICRRKHIEKLVKFVKTKFEI